ncbi:hypothetical protein COT49_00380 [candidate division WWE3 bacterium CG08_land_8_20_14_0_20_40_13]|uniref:Uncharacterized protein n=1 Tax=candidate division WWE3 bacterium CG08_land_8_20_14_0_20_40_13 TaxID=1975084 RepID=A0A2H0XEI0_UNCKA|nr:MAG: hypothetical protein COT49_00380 [candidate division WWE3 bacterium CG08_land_8_20_14_0_20_40_13]
MDLLDTIIKSAVSLLSSIAVLTSTVTVYDTDKIEYGANFSPYYAQNELSLDWKKTYLAVLDDLKIKNLRLGAYWNKIETLDGVYDFSDLDFQILEAKKRDAKVVLAIGRKVPRWPECHDPLFIKGRSENDQREKLLSVIKETVTRYKDNTAISAWQVENEPFFPFGDCPKALADTNFLKREIELVRTLNPTGKIVIQDSGEGGLWFLSKNLGDILAISMYKSSAFKIPFVNKSVYFNYPLPPSFYKFKALVMGVNIEKMIVTELQAEPWGTKPILEMTREEKDHTMSKEKFVQMIEYAKKTGLKDQYFWGVEWWAYEKEVLGNPYFWDTSKALMSDNL